MAKKSKNPIEVLRDAGVDLDRANLTPEMKTNLETFRKKLALEAEGYKKGLKDGKTSLAKRAAGTLLVNPVTKTLVLGGLGSYGILTGLKLANIQPTWLNAGQLDRASDATAGWLRNWGVGVPKP